MALNRTALAAALMTIVSADPASAAPPEQLYAPGPRSGQWALEYNGQAAGATEAERPHSVELWAGLSDRLALGVEVESEVSEEGFRVEEFAVQGLVALTGRGAPVQAALLLQAGVSTEGDLPQLEGRLIASHGSDRWTAVANLIARRSAGHEMESELAYAAALHRTITEGVALGVEASGSVARLAGFDEGYERAHYIGPSLAMEVDTPGGGEAEIGIKLLRRLAGDDAARTTARLVLGWEF